MGNVRVFKPEEVVNVADNNRQKRLTRSKISIKFIS